MKFKLLFLGHVFLLAIIAGSANAAQDALTNLAPQNQLPGYSPGAVVLLPGGQRAIIEKQLSDGSLVTDIGLILSPQGIILNGDDKGETVTLILPETPQKPTREQVRPGTQASPQPTEPRNGQEKKLEAPKTPTTVIETQPEAQKNAESAPEAKKSETPQHYSSLAELLPMTPAPEEKIEAPAPVQKKKPDTAQEKKSSPVPKAEQHKPEKPKEKAKPEKKTAPKNEKPKPGQELRIPPEAAKSGNLDFLEGCWQGTRPEYYSKRTIRECFCFGANGKTGKRRVFDPQGRRQCIGSTHATLSKSGVLSVTSSGAACNDGERWGQAEMVCRNSGPRTPCSWVFRDANNGRQSYEIPFVRVESCGR